MFAEERPEDRVVGVPRLVEIAAQVHNSDGLVL
jgi:hypothetical protein